MQTKYFYTEALFKTYIRQVNPRPHPLRVLIRPEKNPEKCALIPENLPREIGW